MTHWSTSICRNHNYKRAYLFNRRRYTQIIHVPTM